VSLLIVDALFTYICTYFVSFNNYLLTYSFNPHCPTPMPLDMPNTAMANGQRTVIILDQETHTKHY
jgi:hypothetical protein